jgi:hypothetical protein
MQACKVANTVNAAVPVYNSLYNKNFFHPFDIFPTLGHSIAVQIYIQIKVDRKMVLLLRKQE